MLEIEKYVQDARRRFERAHWSGGLPQLLGAIEMLIEAKVEQRLHMRINLMSEDEIAVRRLLPQVRAKAQEIGTMHGAWDLIFDAEALIAGKETLLKHDSREAAMKDYRAMLEKSAA
jgi:hypothetical protein